MVIAIGLLISLIFLILSGIHFYWALGGKWGFDQALSEKETGEKLFIPRKIDSAAVGTGLLLFALFYLIKTGILPINLPNWSLLYGGWIISAIFLLRAIGEFKYVGFFKKVKETNFGRMDSKFYSPLCFLIGSLGVILELI